MVAQQSGAQAAAISAQVEGGKVAVSWAALLVGRHTDGGNSVHKLQPTQLNLVFNCTHPAV